MKQFLWLIFLSEFVYVVSENDGLELLQSVMLCSQDDPAINECLQKGIQDIIPKLKDGSKNLKISALDPILFDNINYDFDNGIIEASIQLSVQVNGLTTAQIKNVNVTINDTEVSLELDVFFPRILVEGKYKTNIGILLNYEGVFKIAMIKLDCVYTMSGDLLTVNGTRYLHLRHYNVDPSVRTMKFHIPNLIDNLVLNHIATKLVNKYWRIPFILTHNIARSSWEPVAIEGLNKFLSVIPFDELLPKNKHRTVI